ncbi:MAG: recombinase family protein [Actinomycetota bacterium]|nr:recombinase family protein [Actinomycetota bacterium]
MSHVRAIIYTRQSLDRNGDGLAVARQEKDCRKLCDQRGWTVIEAVADNDVSASNGKPRPGFTQVVCMIDKRAVDVVVVWTVDRLVRKLADLEDVIERCERAGVKLATVSGDIDLSTDAGRLVGRILASVARGEMERKAARQRRAYLQRAEAGKPNPWTCRPFGYQMDKMTPVPAEARAVAEACEQVLAGGSLRGIAVQWNAAGLTPPQGAPVWKGQTVRAVLGNPRIAGLSAYQGEIVGSGTWPALVSEETWRAVRAVLDDPARRRKTRGVRSLLGGLARCYCGAPAFGTRNSRGAPGYRCREMATRLQPGSRGHVCRLSGPVDDYVTEIVIERLSRPDAADLLIDHSRPDVDALRNQAQVLRARLEELGAEFAMGELPAAQLRVINDRIGQQLAVIEAQIADAGKVSVLGGLVGATDVRAVWGGLDIDRRRAVIDALMSITLHSPGRGARVFDPATVVITPKGQQR